MYPNKANNNNITSDTGFINNKQFQIAHITLLKSLSFIWHRNVYFQIIVECCIYALRGIPSFYVGSFEKIAPSIFFTMIMSFVDGAQFFKEQIYYIKIKFLGIVGGLLGLKL